MRESTRCGWVWALGAVVVLTVVVSGCSKSGGSGEHSTALHQAAERGDVGAVEKLVSEGVDVNVRDEGGATPLHAAAFAGHRDVIRLLIKKGADINLEDNDGDTPLGFAKDDATAALLKGKKSR